MAHYKAVMTGVIPLDEKDEGLSPVKVVVDIKDIYLYFGNLFVEHDIESAAKFFRLSSLVY